MVVGAVSAGPEVFMDNIEANLNEGLLFRGKSQLSKSARAWLIALLKTVLAFSCWMR